MCMSHIVKMKVDDTVNVSDIDILVQGIDENGLTLRYVKFSGENIRKLRKSFKVKQEELAEGLGVSRPLISQYENNELSNPGGELLANLGLFFSERSDSKIVFYVDHTYINENAPD